MMWTKRSGSGLHRWGMILSSWILLFGAIAVSACASSAPATIATVEWISPSAYNQEFGSGEAHFLIDVRTPDEYVSGHIEGAVNMPVENLSQHLDEVPGDVPLIVYCRTGNRSATAAQILVNAGFSPVFDLGGIQTWISAGYPIVR